MLSPCRQSFQPTASASTPRLTIHFAHCATNANGQVNDNGMVVLDPHVTGKVGMMGNFMVSDGQPGPVLRIRASQRKVHLKQAEDRQPNPKHLQKVAEDNNFPRSIQQALIRGFQCHGQKQMALGGMFRVLDGEILAHVMPHGPFGEDGRRERDLADEADLNKWLNFYEVPFFPP